jgi:hypothetical protein
MPQAYSTFWQGNERVAIARKALDHLTAGKEINW